MNDLLFSRGSESSAVASVEALVGQVADDFTQRLNRGEQPDVEEYAQRYPQIAALLRQVLPALQLIRVPAGEPASPSDPSASQPQLAGCLGDFRIIREIGRGGMGIVYEAEQISLERRVALKVLPFAATLDGKQLQRFKHEAQAAGHLHHTNIVPVHAVGCERGVHYYAMQLIDGQTLAAVIHELRQQAGLQAEDDGPLAAILSDVADKLLSGQLLPSKPAGASDSAAAPLPCAPPAPAPPSAETVALAGLSTERSIRSAAYFQTVAHLGMQAAEALEHAHDEGVVHRDIKPANLLVDVKGKLWITDFGLARCRDKAGLTMTGDVVGTLRYMSPEQALAKCVLIDHRTDLYSLGVTLYELLTLEPAFGGSDRQELLRQIAFEEPRRPRRLNKPMPAELETIVLKAMEKNPDDRYASAQELADDLEHFLDNKPIRARPARRWERAWKWARRRPALTAVYGLLLLALMLSGLSSGAVWLWQRAETAHQDALGARDQVHAALQQEQQARAGEAEARGRLAVVSYLHKVQLAHHAWTDNDLLRARLLLDRCPEELRHWEWYHVHRLCHSDRLTLQGHTRGVSSVIYSPDGQRLASASLEDNTVRLWDLATGRQTLMIQTDGVGELAFSSDGRHLLTCSSTSDANKGLPTGGKLKVWDVATSQESIALTVQAPGFGIALMTPDGKRLAAACCVRDPQTRRWVVAEIKVWSLAKPEEVLTLKGHTAYIGHLAFSPDSKRLASTSGDKTVKVWDLSAGQELFSFKGQNGDPVAFSPDGRRLASVSEGETVKLWEVATGQEALALKGSAAKLARLAFSPDGTRLAGSAFDKTVRVWDLATVQEPFVLKGHTEDVHCVAFSPDGRQLATGSADRTIKLWDATPAVEPRTIEVNRGFIFGLLGIAYSPDGRRLATAGADGVVKVWDAATGQEVQALQGHTNVVWSVAFSPDGRHLASSSHDRTVKIWDLTTGRECLTIQGHAGGHSVAYSPDGRRLATASIFDRNLKLWDGATGRELLTLGGYAGSVYTVTFSPDGRQLAAASDENVVKVWDTATGQLTLNLQGHTQGLRGVAFSPDGGRLASASVDSTVRIWDLATGREVRTLYGHTFLVHDVAFSPDGQRLASGSGEGKVKLWDLLTGEETLTLLTDHVTGLAFSPDGRQLAAAVCGDMTATVKLWHAPSMPPRPLGPKVQKD